MGWDEWGRVGTNRQNHRQLDPALTLYSKNLRLSSKRVPTVVNAKCAADMKTGWRYSWLVWIILLKITTPTTVETFISTPTTIVRASIPPRW